ncbi:methylated-DNA--[protein]-cysteine S-methyltransferase [uncultured Jatrophihabitans sp.]|uniref:methylated-DNA--[protein]-cysteine S-methyltransferase n=1 Tax=uncultured Jatrophihabitans sp. TaxID=1610747 RepID=UPI0035CBE984
MQTSTNRHAVVDTALGPLTFVADDAGLAGIYYPGHWTNPDVAAWGEPVGPDHPALAEPVRQIGEYLAGRRRDFDLRLSLRGSARAQQVWQLLARIPYGTTTTYGALAAEVGGGISPRAIGGFVGHNPVSIVVPCHRVVGSTGSLTGYAGGIERKRHLLELEGALAVPEPALW